MVSQQGDQLISKDQSDIKRIEAWPLGKKRQIFFKNGRDTTLTRVSCKRADGPKQKECEDPK